MIGNDIVDINLALLQSNWQRKGFLTKVFSTYEQNAIAKANDSFLMVWRLWSMKESAYKVYLQQTKEDRFFAPKKLKCSILDEINGVVKIDDYEYQTTSVLNKNYIFSEAKLNTNQNIQQTCFFIEDSSAMNQRKKTYQYLKQLVSKTNEFSFDSLQIIKTQTGIPKLYQENNLLDISFSLTHHGNYGAISILT